MPYSLIRSGSTLTVLVTHPQLEDVPRGLTEIQTCLERGGISEIQIAYDESAWATDWAVGTLTAFESSMKSRGVHVSVIGTDARLEPLKA